MIVNRFDRSSEVTDKARRTLNIAAPPWAVLSGWFDFKRLYLAMGT
jgi:hypothetical protein